MIINLNTTRQHKINFNLGSETLLSNMEEQLISSYLGHKCSNDEVLHIIIGCEAKYIIGPFLLKRKKVMVVYTHEKSYLDYLSCPF